MQIETPASLLQRALGDEGFGILQEERGKAEVYGLSPVQADAGIASLRLDNS
jgi:DNA gyrase subunit A